MIDQFPVNSGNVPPPSQSSNFLIHQFNQFQSQKRKSKESRPVPKLKLDRILGNTSTSSNVLATAPNLDLIAYAAGAVVVLYNQKRNKQVGFLYLPSSSSPSSSINNSSLPTSTLPLVLPLGSGNELLASNPTNTEDEKKNTPASTRAKPISCLTFSPDGKYLAAGEMGHQPRIFIWDVKERTLIKELKSHKFGVLSLCFSPNMRYLVSVGFQHDGYLIVWDWKKGIELASNRVTSRVNALSFSNDGSYFVTAGLRHVKFWYLNANGRLPKRGNSRETQVLDGRSCLLGALRDANFVDMACDQSSTGYTYFITEHGILCAFKEGRVIDKWVDLQVKNAFSIAISSKYIICSCAEGVIRLFEPVSLKYVCILPKPHPLGVDVSLITSPDMLKVADDTCYPDVTALAYDERSQRITAVYSDRSLYVWDIRDLDKVGKYRSFLFHSDCVWGIEACPNVKSEESTIPLNSFTSFSADGTVRIWNLEHLNTSLSSTVKKSEVTTPSSSTTTFRKNIYSRDLVKMLYVDPDAAEYSKLKKDIDSSDENYTDFGIRSLKISADGKLMATGDRNGNLRVHNTDQWKQLTYQEAHDSEILSIDMTCRPDHPCLIATASRDRLLHIFNVKSNYQLVQSLDDHSSSITAVKFSEDASHLISCGADKGIVFRQRTHPITPFNHTGPRPYTTYHNYSGRSTVFGMALDKEERFIATTTGERRLYVMSVASGKPFRVCKPETSDEVGKLAEHLGGSLISIDLDPFSGTYAVTSGTDRSIRIFDLTNSYCIEKASAHAETITSVRFVKTGMRGLRVISTSSDGTIFVWQVSDELVSKMCARAGFRTAEENEQSILKQQRTRRVSTASAVRPTASISQMVRQGERRTFSTLSPSEQKYDDVYKKISTHRRNKSEQKIPDGPLAPSKTFDRSPTRGSFLKRENRPTLQQNEQSERISSKPVRPFQMSTGRERKSSQLSPALPRPSSQPPSSNRSNPVLRRALSRDAFRRDETKEPVRNQAPYDNVIKRNDHPVNFNRRESYPTGGNPHNFTFHKNPLHETELENSQNNEIELNNIKEDDIKEEEEEEEDEEDEEEIIFKSEQERATKTFEVTHHPEEIDDGWTTPTSDGETDLSTLLEEDEASNEEDAIVGSITERKPPRITTSLSRTTSHRRSTHSDGGESAQPFTPDEQTKSFIEIQKKLGKIRKRQSITAKFLSSLGVTIPNENTRPSLDHVMTSFHEHASKTIEDKNAADQQTDAEGSDNSQKSASQNTTQISDQSVKHTLEDLDGALVLLDSVMESYIPIAASSDNQAAAALIEKKLNLLMEKISKTVEKPKDNSPEITQLLEKYSSSLLAMVATKMK